MRELGTPDMDDEFSCDPYVISKTMGELNEGERQEYTIGILSMCAGATGKKKGAKRKPSAWNCYIKKNKGQSFAELSPQFKALSQKERREYEELAKGGCIIE